jgi:tripartite-type tricarboxylate transporter receptor subunit TctC
VPGYEASAFFGIGAPKNAPAETIQMLNKVINEVLADPEMKARIADMCDTVLSGSPADFGKLIADETEKWGKVVKFVGIKADFGWGKIFRNVRFAKSLSSRGL